MPHPPKLIPVASNISSQMAMELRVNYLQVSNIEAEIFDSVLKVKVEYKDTLDDLKAQAILKAVKSGIYEGKLGLLEYDNISISIFNTNTIYRYTTDDALNSENSWRVIKTEILNDKAINSEAIFEERAE